MTIKSKSKRVRVQGDTFILCTFSFRWGPCVLTSGNSVEEVLKEIPEWLDGEDTLCFCRVGYWTSDADGDDWRPHDLKTIFQITQYDVDALEDEDEDESICQGDDFCNCGCNALT